MPEATGPDESYYPGSIPLRGDENSVDQERYIEANRTAQILLVALVIIGIIIFAISMWLSGIPVPPEGAGRVLLDRYADSVLLGTWTLLVISVPFSAVWSFYLARMGVKGLACGEFPPPGTLVALRTKVKVGIMARVSNWLALAMAIAFWLPVSILVYSLYLIGKYSY